MWFILVLLAAAVAFYLFWTRKYTFWEDRHVPRSPASFPFGSFKAVSLLKETLYNKIGKIYDEFPNDEVVGMYGFKEPILLVKDAHVARQVTVDNFTSFMDNGFEVSKSVDPILGWNPFCLKGQEWKDVRSYHTPLMTMSKVKGMIPDLKATANELCDYIKRTALNTPVNVMRMARMYQIDAVTRCGYGFESQVWSDPNPLIRIVMNEGIFSKQFETNYSSILSIIYPFGNHLTRFKTFSKDAFKLMLGIYNSVVVERLRSGIKRGDLIQELIGADEKLRAQDKEGLTETTWATNLMVMFMDGTETAHVMLSCSMYLLAKHPEVQDKVRLELSDNNVTLDDLDLDKLKSLVYLEMVLQESARMFPPIPILTRIATKPIKLANVDVPVGMKVVVPAMKFHYDEKYFPNPEIFDPERFSAESKTGFPKGAYAPFGEGPRICLGMNFAKTSIKVALLAVVEKFNLTLGPSHTKNLKTDDNVSFFCFPENGLVEVKFTPL